jgi:CheY-like chemotaxis protein
MLASPSPPKRARARPADLHRLPGTPADDPDTADRTEALRATLAKAMNPSRTAPAETAPPAGGGADADNDRRRPLRVLLVGSDPATAELLREWLTAEGHEVVGERTGGEAAPVSLAIVDVPFARQGADLLRQVAARHPQAPLLALSATFFSSVKCTGDCARSLGVDGVLPKPVSREALLATIGELLRATR